MTEDGRVMWPWSKSAEPDPEPPQKVRMVHPDGTEWPLECRYEGMRDGVHRWCAVGSLRGIMEPGASLAVDVLPGRTSIELGWDDAGY